MPANSQKCLGDLTFDYRHIIINDEEEYITIWESGTPIWCEVYHDACGIFVDYKFQKHYLDKEKYHLNKTQKQ